MIFSSRGLKKNFHDIVSLYRSEFRWPIGKIYNGAFGSVDAEFYYSIVRTLSPDLSIEIGSGHSTWFALDALIKNEKGSIISIDPLPRRKMPSLVKHLKKRVEEVDIELFNSLKKNDILFIDSSHTQTEALYHVNEILPRLSSGVVIHHHDMMYPYLPCYEEEAVILDFYKNNASFDVLSSMAYIRYHNAELIRNLIPSFLWNEEASGGSLWSRKQ